MGLNRYVLKTLEKSLKEETFEYPGFQVHMAASAAWARVAAQDIAGNSCFGMPVFLKK